MNLFKQRKNKTFSYTLKHQKEEELKASNDLASQWAEIRKTNKRKKNIFTTLPFMVLFLIAVLVILYILSRYE